MDTCPPHRFRLAEANGNSRIPGTCQNCGETRTWFASQQDGRSVKEMAAKRPKKRDAA